MPTERDDPVDPVAFTETLAVTRGDSPARDRSQMADPPGGSIESAERDLAELPTISPDNYVFGRYFARGGMGRIAAVRDRRLGRVVAIKELISDRGDLDERFRREVSITAQLQHPAIVSVHEAGRWPTGEPFFAMKLVSGDSLHAVIERTPSPEERLALLSSVIAIVDALAYAHDRGIIHRDLKPANVLIGQFGETVVIDWGLAKNLRLEHDEADPVVTLQRAPDADMTVAGSVLGTPAFMAPEQARGEAADERTDVYALGAILYTVLVGEPPYRGPDSNAILRELLAGEPIPPGERAPGVPQDLQTIVAKAMARDAASRYPSAKELAIDLKRFQTGQLVGAHRYSTRDLVLRWLRRHRAAVVVAAVAVGTLAAVGAASVSRVVRERDVARAARAAAAERADAHTLSQARALVDSDPLASLELLATLSADSGAWDAARVIAADAAAVGIPGVIELPGSGPVAARASPIENIAAYALGDGRVRLVDVATGQIRVGAEHTGTINDVAFSPDGQTLAVASQDNTIGLWTRDGKKLRSLAGHEGWVLTVEFSPDRSHLVSTSLDGTGRIWNLATGETQVISPPPIRGSFSADGARLAGVSAADARRLAVYDVSSGRHKVLAGDHGQYRAAALSRDGNQVVSAGRDGAIRIWDVATGESRVFGEHQDEVDFVAFSRDGALLASASEDHTVGVWRFPSGKRWTYRGFAHGADALAFSPDGRWIVAWNDDEVHLIDVSARSGRRLHRARGSSVFSHDSRFVLGDDGRNRLFVWSAEAGGERFEAGARARAAAFSPDGAHLAAAGPGWSLRLWDPSTRQHRDLRGHAAAVEHVAFSPNGALLASSDAIKRIRVWSVSSGEGVTLPGRALGPVVFSPDGHQLAAAGDDQSVRVWDIATGELRSLSGHKGWVAQVVFSPTGRELASVGSDGEVRIWDVATGDGRLLGSHGGAIWRAAYSPRGDLVATACADGMIGLWPVAGGAERTIAGHEAWAVSLAFSPSGAELVSVGVDGTTRLSDVSSGTLRILGQRSGAVFSVEFSPDGRTVAIGGDSGWAQLIDVRSGNERVLRGHAGEVVDVRFSPDGTRVATLATDRTVRVWDDDLPQDRSGLEHWIRDRLQHLQHAGATLQP